MKHLLRIFLVSFAMLAGVVTIAAGYGGMVNPLSTTLPALIAMTFPVCLLVDIALILVGLLFCCRAAAVIVLSIAVTAGPLLTFCPVHFGDRAPEGDAPELRVMTYNVMQLDDYTRLHNTPASNPTMQFILGSDADIVALQECPTLRRAANTDVRTSRGLLDSVAARYPYRAFGREGQALLSRYPFTEVALSRKPDHSFQVRAYRIESPLGDITLFNLHLKSIGLTDGDKALYRQWTDGEAARGPIREELRELRRDVLSKLSAAFRERAVQARAIREMIDSVGGTVLVCGDFNDIPGSYAARKILATGLDDAYREAGCGPAITYHASRFYFRIDHIFASPSLRPVDAFTLRNPTSDHYPVEAVFVGR